jgi:Xaa-Pro aminopeptidase
MMDGRDAVWCRFATHKGLETRIDGSQYSAYGSIVAAGANAGVLYYRADAGGQVLRSAAITR